MAFITFLPLLLPLAAVAVGFIIAIFSVIGISLFLIGITGMIMNKIYKTQTKADHGVVKPLYNVSAIILGIMIFLFPLAYVLVGIISAFINRS